MGSLVHWRCPKFARVCVVIEKKEAKFEEGALKNLTNTYRGLQIWAKFVGEVYGVYLIPVQTIIVKFVVVASYLLVSEIKKGDVEPVSLVVLGFCIHNMIVGWALMLIYGGYIHTQSKRCIGSWKYVEWEVKMERKCFNVVVKSCPAVCFGYEKYFEVTKMSAVKFGKVVVRGLLRALLAMK